MKINRKIKSCRILILFLLLSSFALPFVSFPFVFGAVELFSDTFDDGTLDAWDGNGGGNVSATVTRPFAGSHSLEAFDSIRDDAAVYYDRAFDIGTTYNLSAWINYEAYTSDNANHRSGELIYGEAAGLGTYNDFGCWFGIHKDSGDFYLTHFLWNDDDAEFVDNVTNLVLAFDTWYGISLVLYVGDNDDGYSELWVNGSKKSVIRDQNTTWAASILAGNFAWWGTQGNGDMNLFVDNVLLESLASDPAGTNPAESTHIITKSCEFSSSWACDIGLSGYIFGTNNTGSWVNETWSIWAGSPTTGWANETKTINSTAGVLVQWQVWANDTENDWGDLGLQSFTTLNFFNFSGHSSNDTQRDSACRFNVTAAPNTGALSHYIFSTNNTGSWANDTAAPGSSPLTDVHTLNITEGVLVQWQWFVNNTANDWQASAIQSLTTTAKSSDRRITTWEAADSETFHQSKIVRTADNTTHVLLYRENFVTHYYLPDGETTWIAQNVWGIQDDKRLSCSLDVDSSDNLHAVISWHPDETQKHLYILYPQYLNATVEKVGDWSWSWLNQSITCMDDETDFVEANIILDSNDQIHVVAARTTSVQEAGYSYSIDGATFTEKSDTYGGDFKPSLAADASGNVFLLDGPLAVHIDNTFEWVTNQSLGGGAIAMFSSPSAVIDDNNFIHVAFYNQTEDAIYFMNTTSASDVSSWRTPVKIYDAPETGIADPYETFGCLMWLSNATGVFRYFFSADSQNVNGDIFYSESSDWGATWGAAVAVTNNNLTNAYPNAMQSTFNSLDIMWSVGTDKVNFGYNCTQATLPSIPAAPVLNMSDYRQVWDDFTLGNYSRWTNGGSTTNLWISGAITPDVANDTHVSVWNSQDTIEPSVSYALNITETGIDRMAISGYLYVPSFSTAAYYHGLVGFVDDLNNDLTATVGMLGYYYNSTQSKAFWMVFGDSNLGYKQTISTTELLVDTWYYVELDVIRGAPGQIYGRVYEDPENTTAIVSLQLLTATTNSIGAGGSSEGVIFGGFGSFGGSEAGSSAEHHFTAVSVFNTTLAPGLTYEFNITDMEGCGTWLFAEERYYNFQLNVTHPSDASLIDHVEFTFFDGQKWAWFYYDQQASLNDSWVNVYIDQYDIVRTAVGNTSLSGGGRKLTLNFKVYLVRTVLDVYGSDCLDIYYRANMTDAPEWGSSNWELAEDFVQIYNMGGFSLEYTSSDLTHAYRVIGGDVFDFFASNYTQVYSDYIWRGLVHTKYMVAIEGICGYNTFHMSYGLDYCTKEDDWLDGFYVKINPLNITSETYVGHNNSRDICLKIEWYLNNTLIKNDIIWAFHRGKAAEGEEFITRLWIDLWYNQINGSTIIGGRVNAYEYPMIDTSSLWFRWLSSDWGINHELPKEAMCFIEMKDGSGVPLQRARIKMSKLWANLTVSANATTNQTVRLGYYQVFDMDVRTDPQNGIQTPTFEETAEPMMARGGLLGSIFAAFSNLIKWLSDNVIYGGLSLWPRFVQFMDTIAGWLGFPGGFTTLIDWLGNAWTWFVDSLSYLASLIGAVFQVLSASMSKIITVLQSGATIIVNYITGIDAFLNDSYESGVNIWNDLGLSTWLYLGLVCYPIYLIFLWDLEGTDALIRHLTFLFNVGYWLFNMLVTIFQMIINIIGRIIESIPIVE